MYLSKDVLVEKALNKVNELINKDFNTMKTREKATHSIELEKIYNDLSPYRVGSEDVDLIADACLQVKRKIAESEINKY